MQILYCKNIMPGELGFRIALFEDVVYNILA